MTDVVLERLLPAAVDRVFDFVTRRQNVLTWWGPEGGMVHEESLDLSRLGPWFSVFTGAEGRRYKVSGQVTRVERPTLVAFTWGWHDDTDARGRETHVTIEISAAGPDRSRLVLRHAGLADDTTGAHSQGWQGALNNLERALAA
jgi:uncharacterized protein YndB with AHSA1/START domain